MHRSSSSHASDTDRVADLRDLTRGQDTFARGEVVLKGILGVSTAGEFGSGANGGQLQKHTAAGFDKPKEGQELLPILRLRHGGLICGRRSGRRFV